MLPRRAGGGGDDDVADATEAVGYLALDPEDMAAMARALPALRPLNSEPACFPCANPARFPC